MTTPGEITTLLRRWDDERDVEALNEALPYVMHELRRQARHYLRGEVHEVFQPTELVSEVYLRLLGSRVHEIGSRGEFFAFAARLMRQILIEAARQRMSAKRGGESPRVCLDAALDVPEDVDAERFLIVHDAVERLGRINKRQRQIVELRYYLGLTVAEVSDVLGISVAAVERGWQAARCWLLFELGSRRPSGYILHGLCP